MKSLKIAVLYGGQSTEHEVSLVSARSVMDHLDSKKYRLTPILIPKNNPDWSQIIKEILTCDVVFPVLHGYMGEDGLIQGLLETLNIPYVGCGLAASAICMDKDLQKRLCQSVGLPVSPSITLNKARPPYDLEAIIHNLKLPLFIKPSSTGSSVGVTKAHNLNEVQQGLKLAFSLDTKVILEKAVDVLHEVECAVLGPTVDPQVSVIGEIISSNEFYDYDAKYIDGVSKALIPAPISKKLTHQIQSLAKKAFTTCECYGLARIDFLIDKNHQIYLLELNTLPGFTSISMYPKLMAASGISYQDLLTQLIDLSLKKHDEKTALNRSYTPKSAWYK